MTLSGGRPEQVGPSALASGRGIRGTGRSTIAYATTLCRLPLCPSGRNHPNGHKGRRMGEPPPQPLAPAALMPLRPDYLGEPLALGCTTLETVIQPLYNIAGGDVVLFAAGQILNGNVPLGDLLWAEQ